MGAGQGAGDEALQHGCSSWQVMAQTPAKSNCGSSRRMLFLVCSTRGFTGVGVGTWGLLWVRARRAWGAGWDGAAGYESWGRCRAERTWVEESVTASMQAWSERHIQPAERSGGSGLGWLQLCA